MADIRLVIFDCDGVLFDTFEVNRTYYNRILSHFNRPEMTGEQIAYVHMHAVNHSLAYLFQDNDEEREAAEAFRKSMSYADFLKYMEPEPYLKPLLKKLRPRYRTAIVTNRTDTMNRVLNEFDLKGDFDLVVTAFDVPRPKPYPDGLIKTLEHFKVSPSQAIYVGDSEVDETAAKEAGVPLVAFNNPSLSGAYHVRNLKELEEILF